MKTTLELEPRANQYGCGIYETGPESLRLFVTDGGRVIPVQGRMITAEDLMNAYVWGRLEERGEPSQPEDEKVNNEFS
jgi:hypothetical protein